MIFFDIKLNVDLVNYYKIKNGTDLSQDKFILSKEKEIEDNQKR